MKPAVKLEQSLMMLSEERKWERGFYVDSLKNVCLMRLERWLSCSSRWPRFHSQHPHNGSQPSVTPVPGNLTPSSDLFGHQKHTLYTDIDAGKNTNAHG